MQSTDIWSRKLRLDKERRAKHSELTKEFDETCYWPEYGKIIEDCGKIGHHMVFGGHSIGGMEYYTCTNCNLTQTEEYR